MTVTLSIASVVWAVVALLAVRLVVASAMRALDVRASAWQQSQSFAKRMEDLEAASLRRSADMTYLANEVIRIKNIEGISD